MKKLLLALAFCLAASAASAQCSGVFTTGTVCGNATGSKNTPRMTPSTSFSPSMANPSGLIGMSAVNGAAITAERSDSTHAIDPAIAPSWTGQHTFSLLPIFPAQSANTVFAGPTTGLAAIPGYRALVSADIPPINLGSTANGGITGTLLIGHGGTGATSFTANDPLIGAGTSPIAQGTRSGNTTKFGTVSGTIASGNCIKADASGNLVDAGTVCGSGGLPVGYVSPSVVADGRIVADGAISASSSDFVSASSTCSSADVGKALAVAGAGPVGQAYVFSTTISSCGAAHHFNLAGNATNTVSGAKAQWCTDITTTMNTAIQGFTSGGVVMLPSGIMCWDRLNMTAVASITLRGTSWGVNNINGSTLVGIGTVILPTKFNSVMIDTTASSDPIIENLQLGSNQGAVTAYAAILNANSTTISTDGIYLNHVFVQGKWSLGALNLILGGHAYVDHSRFWNYLGTQYVAIIGRDNPYAISSTFQTIATTHANGSITAYNSEFHDYTGSATSAGDIRFDGSIGSLIMNSGLDSSSTTSNIIFQQTDSTVSEVMLINNVFYSEAGIPATYSYCYSGTAGVDLLSAWNNKYSPTTKLCAGYSPTFTTLE